MRNLTLDPKEFKKEIQVVMEERRMRTEDKPEGKLFEQFNSTAYRVHPYGNPIIGWMEDLKGLTVDDVAKWYRRWYAPNNATLVVVGDVEPKEVLALAKKYFGPVPRQELKPSNLPAEPPQTETRRVVVKEPATVPSIILGYHVPVLGQAKPKWEPYALEVLAGILDGGKSARFSTELVRNLRIASSAGAGYDAVSRAPSMFLLNGTPANGHTTAQLEQALLDQIERVKKEPVNDDELQRVKAQVTASDVYKRDSVFYQAMEIGMLESSGLSREYVDEYVDRINAITAKQVREVAEKYLVNSNLTVAVLEPQGFGKARRTPRAIPGGIHGH